MAFDFPRVAATLAAGATGAFAGETGLARNDFGGDDCGGRRGDCGRVLELCDFGDRTEDGLILRETARPAQFAAVVGLAVLLRFLGFSKSAWMFSLSDMLRNSVLVRFVPLEVEEAAVLGRELELAGILRGSGSGFDIADGCACGF